MEKPRSNLSLTQRKYSFWQRAVVVLAAVLLFVAGSLIAYRLISGRSLGLRSYAENTVRTGVDFFKALRGRQRVIANNRGEYTNIIFLHHSVGHNLIAQGDVRQLFKQAGYDFWDHDYNYLGVTSPDGMPVGYSYNIPGDNTEPDGLLKLFQQKPYDLPVNAFSNLLQHEVIVFKSCYPASDISSDEELEFHKQWYLSMRDVMDRYPDKKFVVLTQPPLHPAETNSEDAARARAIADWLSSEEFQAGHPNISTFDFFNLLAESNPDAPDANMLKAVYRQGYDSHPNQLANESIAPIFVNFVINAIEQ
jgi:hypothetical protein